MMKESSTLDLGIWDLSSRLTFWKLDRLEKEKSLVSEHLRELVLSEETAETPIKNVDMRRHTAKTWLKLQSFLFLVPDVKE